MKVYEIAAVIDRGSYYEVEYITTSLTREFRTNQRYLGLNSSTAEMIQEGLDNNRNIRIIKDYQDIDVQPHDIIITDEVDTEIDAYRKVITKKIRQHVTHQQANVSGIMLYEFTSINNYLCDKGFYIHDDNKEEVYLNILETGDEQLIDKLEIYLNAKDYISRASSLEHKYFDFYQEVKQLESKEEIDKLYNNFMEYLKVVSKQ